MGRHSVFEKQCTADSLSLDLKRWNREGLTKPGTLRSGVWQWKYGTPEQVSTVRYVLDLQDETASFLRLQYTTGEKSFDYRVKMETTFPHFGGVRWWFRCPLLVNGRACDRRVRVLYLNGRYFGCRDCHHLTYKSTQEWDPRVSGMLKNPEAMRGLMTENAQIGDLFLAMKVLLRMRSDDEKGKK